MARLGKSGRPDAATIHLARAPRSLNQIGDVNTPLRLEAMEWSTQIARELRAAELPPGLSHVEASVTLAFTTRRRRSADNYRPLLVRAVRDALVDGGWLVDASCFTFGEIAFEKGEAATAIALRWSTREGESSR